MEIQGFENYLIYSDGSVFSKKYNRFKKPTINNIGYQVVNLHKDGKYKTLLLHRLIAIHYISNPENKPEVDHINRNRSDNRIENLRWVTSSENIQNTGLRNTNTSGHKYICYCKRDKVWIFQKRINGKKTQKRFKNLDEAIEFKRSFET